MDLLPNRIPNSSLKIISTEKLEDVKSLAPATFIGTHSGVFHCDEVLACSLLKYTANFSNATIVRSRNDDIHAIMDILIDVGSVFDPSKN